MMSYLGDFDDGIEDEILLCLDDPEPSRSNTSDLEPVVPSTTLTLPPADLVNCPANNDGGEGQPSQDG